MSKGLTGTYLKPATRKTGKKELRAELGRFICKHRIAAGFDQSKLSETCGYNYNVVQRWENAEKPAVTLEDTEKLAKVLNLPETAFEPYGDILGRKDTGEQLRHYRKERDRSIGLRIDSRLKELSMTPSEFARAIDLYPQHINGFIKGLTEPKLFYIKKMNEILFPEDMQMEGLMYLLYGKALPKVAYLKQVDIAIERIKYLTSENKQLKGEE